MCMLTDEGFAALLACPALAAYATRCVSDFLLFCFHGLALECRAHRASASISFARQWRVGGLHRRLSAACVTRARRYRRLVAPASLAMRTHLLLRDSEAARRGFKPRVCFVIQHRLISRSRQRGGRIVVPRIQSGVPNADRPALPPPEQITRCM